MTNFDMGCLSATPGLYAQVLDVEDAIALRGSVPHNAELTLSDAELFLAVAAFHAEPPSARAWPTAESLPGGAKSYDPPKRKWPGMGVPLGCEFLRNLGWNGFKPDTHISRLLTTLTDGAGHPLTPEAAERARAIQSRVGRRTNETHGLLMAALIGVALTRGRDYARADNVLWLYGSTLGRRESPLPWRYLTLS